MVYQISLKKYSVSFKGTKKTATEGCQIKQFP